MRKILLSTTLILLALGVHAQSLRFASVGSGIYCRFSPDCKVTPTEQSDSTAVTNVTVTCVLESRSIVGNTMDSSGKYGYEYMLTLNNASAGSSDTNIVTVNSLTLNFGDPSPFAFGEHASNQVWALTSDGPVGLAPASADADGKKVNFSFDPPLVLNTTTAQTTNTCYFGMISTGSPEITTAIVSGSAQGLDGNTTDFKAKLQTQTP